MDRKKIIKEIVSAMLDAGKAKTDDVLGAYACEIDDAFLNALVLTCGIGVLKTLVKNCAESAEIPFSALMNEVIDTMKKFTLS